MQNRVFIKPRLIDGVAAVIPDPHAGGAPLKPEGEYKPRSAFWLRRINDGDVVEASPATSAPKPPRSPITPKPKASAAPSEPDAAAPSVSKPRF